MGDCGGILNVNFEAEVDWEWDFSCEREKGDFDGEGPLWVIFCSADINLDRSVKVKLSSSEIGFT